MAARERLSHASDVLIYVKRLGLYGYRHDEDTCDPTEPVEELIARLAEEVAGWARFDPEPSGEAISKDEKPSLTPLREEIMRDHAHYRPARRADIALVRIEDA